MLSQQPTGEVVSASRRNAGEKSYVRVARRLTTLHTGDGWGTEDSRDEPVPEDVCTFVYLAF